MSSNKNDDYLERVKAEIRAEADLARARAPLPRVDVPASAVAVCGPDGIERSRLDYTISELTGAQYSTFIDQAFRALLKRAPDDAGSAMQVRLLAAGASKAEILGNLRWSPEGRRVGTRVRGLLPRYAQAKLARVPVFGYFVDWGLALAGLPVLLRHQRAADTSVAARFDASVDAQRGHDQRLASLDTAVAELGAERDRRNADAEAQREHGRRLDELTTRVSALDQQGTTLATTLRHIAQRLHELERHAVVTRTRGDAAQNQIEALHERGNAMEGRAGAVEGRAVTLEARIAPLETRAAELDDRLDARIVPLEARAAALEGHLEARIVPLEARASGLEGCHSASASEMIELRHYVHAANHWITSMQNSLVGLEEASAAERERADALGAALELDSKIAEARTARHADWTAKLASGLPAAARVLDLGSGDGTWLEAVNASGMDASGIESNRALVAHAQARKLPIAAGDPLAALARCADADLDAITIGASTLSGDDSIVARTLDEIRRALKADGRVLLRVEDEPHRLGELLGPRPTNTDAQRWAALLTAAEFVHAEVLSANGANAVLAQRAAS